MAKLKSQALFYPASFPRADLLQLVLGTLQDDLDLVSFDDEAGGIAERELAIPYLPGMDEVRVESARFGLQTQEKPFEVTSYSVTKTSGAERGIVLALNEESRVLKVDLGYPQFPDPVKSELTRYRYLDGKIQSRPDGAVKNLHLIIRPATKSGAGFSFGPPIFADPPFIMSPLYGPILSGISVFDLGNSRFQIAFPKARGAAFLLQLAHGDSPADLQPVDFDAAVRRVVVDAAVRSLTVRLATEDPVVLWSHPEVLLPDAGVQEVDFTPLAERQLQKALGEMGGSSTELTLPLRLSFESASAGAVGLSAKTLSAEYIVRPLGETPSTSRLEGSWHPLRLDAPAGRRPEKSSFGARLKLLGRELNAGSSPPPLEVPSRGLRVNGNRWLAGGYEFLRASSSTDAPALPLVGVRTYLGAQEDAEVVLELRADVAGTVGAPLSNPLVAQLHSGFSGWLHFELSPALMLPSDSTVWVVLRANQGEVLWFTSGAGQTKISLDRGKAWGRVESKLSATSRPLVQMFQEVPDPQPKPQIQVRVGETVVATNLFGSAARLSDREFLASAVPLPDSILDLLAVTSGSDRVATELSLFSPSMLDLIVDEASLGYDPFG